MHVLADGEQRCNFRQDGQPGAEALIDAGTFRRTLVETIEPRMNGSLIRANVETRSPDVVDGVGLLRRQPGNGKPCEGCVALMATSSRFCRSLRLLHDGLQPVTDIELVVIDELGELHVVSGGRAAS
ncbi:hypothetical protein EB233_31525 [Mesorhizobium erdmanii]|uniref:Uncharacterized protein n=1 Tax=Mesorhizobium erdmanii TaxID=1777866 RepID=A0A6M7UTX8_9HYPH|nr:hypothetical protein EB233_31525 [Mesorhizobium erdmanii]